MTAYEYLNQIRLIEAKISMLKKQIQKIEARSRTAGMTEAQRASLKDCQAKLIGLIMESAKRSGQIEETVEKAITDPREYKIILMRYWDARSWYDIAREMALESSLVYRLHRRALQRLAPYIAAQPESKQDGAEE